MSTPQERLFGGYYNSAGFSGVNPGGLGNGGHVQNFPPALQDIGVVSQDVGVKSAAATAAAASAALDKTAAETARTQAQAAAAAAAAFDPTTKVSKTGDTMTGALRVSGSTGRVELLPAVGAGFCHLNFTDAVGVYQARLYATTNTQFFEAVAGRTWRFNNPVLIEGLAPFTTANDGSGSGFDADLLRGKGPSWGATGNTIPERAGDGSTAFTSVHVSAGVVFTGLGALTIRDANNMGFDKGLYLSLGLSASTVTERSDRRLKTCIEDVKAEGRLRPRRYVMKADGAGRVGFIAQEVAEVCPEAVTIGSDGVLELNAMTLVAHLAGQLNDALDRIAALENRQ